MNKGSKINYDKPIKISTTTASKNPFENSVLTTILVVSDIEKSKQRYLDILGAKLEREYGGDSVVREFLGSWLLLVSSGGPTENKSKISFITPDHQYLVDPKKRKKQTRMEKPRIRNSK